MPPLPSGLALILPSCRQVHGQPPVYVLLGRWRGVGATASLSVDGFCCAAKRTPRATSGGGWASPLGVDVAARVFRHHRSATARGRLTSAAFFSFFPSLLTPRHIKRSDSFTLFAETDWKKDDHLVFCCLLESLLNLPKTERVSLLQA